MKKCTLSLGTCTPVSSRNSCKQKTSWHSLIPVKCPLQTKLSCFQAVRGLFLWKLLTDCKTDRHWLKRSVALVSPKLKTIPLLYSILQEEPLQTCYVLYHHLELLWKSQLILILSRLKAWSCCSHPYGPVLVLIFLCRLAFPYANFVKPAQVV